MNGTFIISSVIVALLASSGCPSGSESAAVNASMSGSSGGGSQSSVSIEYFHGRLSPYGRWIDYAGYGWCWSPTVVASDWRPYSDGYWVYSDLGWTWVSNEPWGWATYHYGRWVVDPYYGWVWVPDPVWGPSWVSWRMDGEWVGWAPLPPEASWRTGAGLRYASVEVVPANQWCFVRRDHIGDRNLRARLEPEMRSVALLQRTRDVTRFETAGGRPMNRGPAVEALERPRTAPVPRVKVRDVNSPERGRGQFMGSGSVGFFRPELRDRGKQPSAPPKKTDERWREQDRKKDHNKHGRPGEGPQGGAADRGLQESPGDRSHG